MKLAKQIFVSIITAITIMSLPALTINAESTDNNNKSQAEYSLYFDNEQSHPYLHSSSGHLYPTVSIKGEKGSSLEIDSDFNINEGAVLKSDVIYFNSSDFGLKDFSGCKINASIFNPTSDNIAEIEFFTDGVSFVSKKIPQNTEFVPIDLNNGNEPNTMLGIYIKFKESNTGQICMIDNLKIEKADGTIATIDGINDEVKYEKGHTVLSIILFVVLIGIVIFGIIFLIKNSRGRFR